MDFITFQIAHYILPFDTYDCLYARMKCDRNADTQSMTMNLYDLFAIILIVFVAIWKIHIIIGAQFLCACECECVCGASEHEYGHDISLNTLKCKRFWNETPF